MKTKQTSIVLASLLLIQNVALAQKAELSASEIRDAAKAVTAVGSPTLADLKGLVNEGDQEAIEELLLTYKQVRQMADSLRAMQNTNSNDTLLNIANKAQVVLVGTSALLLHSHVKNAEKARYQLQLAAASALLNSFIRHYAEIKNLKPEELGSFLTTFNREMTESKIMTPELLEMSTSIANISDSLIQQKTTIDTIVAKLGGGSDLATGALVILSLAHWINPKIAKEGEAVIKTMSQRLASNGAGMSQSGRVVGVSGGVAGVPDLIGVSLGLDSEKSRQMITQTLNSLDLAARKLQAEIHSKSK